MDLSPVSSTTTLPSSGMQSVESLTPSKSVLDQALDILMDDLAKHKYPEGKVNVVEALQEFWEQKRPTTGDASLPAEPGAGPRPLRGVAYESEPSDGPPYSCFVTLPCGACFASYQPCQSKAEARRSAARVALLNSVVDEHKERRISDRLIETAVQNLRLADQGASSEAVAVLRQALSAHHGLGLLQWEARLFTLRLLHWNDSLRAMRERGATRNQVLDRYAGCPVDDNTRSQIALDWMTREQTQPGCLAAELRLAVTELRQKQALGRELRFEKERVDILTLAQRQLAADAAAMAENNGKVSLHGLRDPRVAEHKMESRA